MSYLINNSINMKNDNHEELLIISLLPNIHDKISSISLSKLNLKLWKIKRAIYEVLTWCLVLYNSNLKNSSSSGTLSLPQTPSALTSRHSGLIAALNCPQLFPVRPINTSPKCFADRQGPVILAHHSVGSGN